MGSYEWTTAESPREAQLSGVESDGDDAFAAGSRGLLLQRRARGEWRELVPDGPAGDNTNLNDLALTDGGRRLWYCGDSGAFGYYDRAAEEAVPHTAPKSHSDGFQAIAVRGPAGREIVHTVDDAGRILRAAVDGERVDVTDDEVPQDGSTLTAIVEHESYRYAADASGSLLRTVDGVEWTAKRFVETTVEALATDRSGVAAITDDGVLYRGLSVFGEPGRTAQADLGDVSPEDVAATDGTFVVVGDDATVFVIDGDGRPIQPDPGVDAVFYGAELLADRTVLAVGEDGTILEGRPRA